MSAAHSNSEQNPLHCSPARSIRTVLAKKRQIGHSHPGDPTPFHGVDGDPKVAGVGLRSRPWRIVTPNMLVLAGDNAQAAAGALGDVNKE